MPSTSKSLRSNGAGPGRAAPSRDVAKRPDLATTTQRFARRNRTRVAFGALLIVACTLAAAVMFSRAGDRHPVLAVVHRVEAGSTIAAGDLSEVLVAADAGVATVPSSQRDRLVGQIAVVDLTPGALLAPGQIEVRPSGTNDKAVVGAAVKEGQYPPGLRAGDHVLLVEVPAQPASGEPSSSGTTQLVPATVLSVAPAQSSGAVSVALAIDPARAQSVAVDAARGQLSIVLAPA